MLTPLTWRIRCTGARSATATSPRGGRQLLDGGVVAAELLRDLIDIPERVHAGDFVLNLSKGVVEESTVSQYVVTDQLAECFDEALGIIQRCSSSVGPSWRTSTPSRARRATG